MSKLIEPLNNTERKFAEENYPLIDRFLKIKKVNPEDMFDVVVFDYLESVTAFLNDPELQKKTNFEAVSFMYMNRALLNHYASEKAQKRCSGIGADVSIEDAEMENYLPSSQADGSTEVEYMELLKGIKAELTEEQQKIFADKLEGYSLKEIAEINGIKEKRVYKQFAKVKGIVAVAMGL